MTTILDEIRRLEAAKARGDMTESEHAMAKARLMAGVEDADTDVQDVLQPSPPKSFRLFDVVTFLIIVTIGCFGLATLLLGDIMLAATITLTLLAALTVRAFRTLDD